MLKVLQPLKSLLSALLDSFRVCPQCVWVKATEPILRPQPIHLLDLLGEPVLQGVDIHALHLLGELIRPISLAHMTDRVVSSWSDFLGYQSILTEVSFVNFFPSFLVPSHQTFGPWSDAQQGLIAIKVIFHGHGLRF